MGAKRDVNKGVNVGHLAYGALNFVTAKVDVLMLNLTLMAKAMVYFC